jgi:hypothetical protein
MGARALDKPGRSATRWAARERGRAGPPNFGPVVQGVIKFFFFKPFQYLLPKYDSNSNSNFEQLLFAK